jgi:hypothetical protein
MILKLTASIMLLSLIAGIGVRKARSQTPEAPQPCRVGYQAPAIGFWTWAANTHVKVYVRSADFKPEEIPYLLASLETWNEVSELTGSRVKFDYQGSTPVELSCESCLTVMRGTVFDKSKRHATEIKAYSLHHDQIINYASIVVDPVLTNPRALRDAMAHELGHNLGLLDCFTCKSKSTLMNQFKVINVPNNVPAPTSCDIAQVRLAYQELKVRVRASPADRRLIDQGEEPVDDDTPIVVPKPPN